MAENNISNNDISFKILKPLSICVVLLLEFFAYSALYTKNYKIALLLVMLSGAAFAYALYDSGKYGFLLHLLAPIVFVGALAIGAEPYKAVFITAFYVLGFIIAKTTAAGTSRSRIVIAGSIGFGAVILLCAVLYIINKYGSISGSIISKFYNVDIRTLYDNNINFIKQMMSESTQNSGNASSIADINSLFDSIFIVLSYCLPGFFICLCNIVSYVSVLVFHAIIRGKNMVPQSKQLTIGVVGAAIFILSNFISIKADLINNPNALQILAINLILIYMPGLFVIGLRSFFSKDPAVIRKNMTLIILVIIFIIYNVYLVLWLLAFVGALNVITRAIVLYKIKKDGENNQ